MTDKTAKDYLAIALDTPDLEKATRIAKAVQPSFAVAKVGLELFSAAGKEAVAVMRDLGFKVFLDVKLHDIPNTVNKAARVLGEYGATYLTMHSIGGADMLKAGMEGLAEGAAVAGNPPPKALAVTILTSDKTATPDGLKRRLSIVTSSGCSGVICAATDLEVIKDQAPEIFAVTPGIRPAGAPTHDQGRIATPAEAIKSGADLLVIGRAVTEATDPELATGTLAEEVGRHL